MRWIWLLVLSLGCGDDSTTADAGPDDAAADAPPEWPDFPGMLTIGEGERIRLEAPAGIDITSTTSLDVDAREVDGAVTIFAPYGVTGGQVAVSVANEAGSNMFVAGVEVEPIAWGTPLVVDETGPEAREHPALLMDEARNRLLVLGGSGYRPYGTPLDDAWAIDLTSGTWSELTVTGTLPALGSMRVAHRSGETSALLFGGYGAMGAGSSALIRVDFSGEGLNVGEVPQTGYLSAAARSLHSFFHDPETDTYWTFGGLAGSAPRGDVRRMQLVDGSAEWTFEETVDGPSGRYGFFYGFDAERGRLYVFSGAQGTREVDPARDLWMLDVRTSPASWTLLMEGDALPEGRRNGIFAWDPRGPRLWIYGGTPDAMTGTPGLFVFDLGAEPDVIRLELAGEPPLRSSGVGIFDAVHDRMLAGFGNSESAIYADLQTIITGS